MAILDRLERRFHRWAIPNLTAVIIAGQVLLYFLQQIRGAQGGGGDVLGGIHLIPARVMAGEVWRLVTFAFVPPQTNLLFAAIAWMIFYLFGSSLENHWGTVRYNIFLLIGLLANIAAAMLVWAAFRSHYIASNAFLYSTVFLAFARLFPDFVIHLFFILPIKVKWLAMLMWIGFAYGLLTGGWMDRMLIIASVANYLVFFGREHLRDVKHSHRRRTFQAKTQQSAKPIQHECRVCGLNSEESPKTLFRYCSKCEGQCCYCPEHIRNHEHVVCEEAPDRESPEKAESRAGTN